MFQSEFLPSEVCHPYVALSNVPEININLDYGTLLTNISGEKINQYLMQFYTQTQVNILIINQNKLRTCKWLLVATYIMLKVLAIFNQRVE